MQRTQCWLRGGARAALVLVLGLALLAPAPGGAGDKIDPEINDNTGDTLLSAVPDGGSWADFRQVWFTTAWKTKRVGTRLVRYVTGFRVHANMMGGLPSLDGDETPDLNGLYKFYWDLRGADGCRAEVYVWRTVVKRPQWVNNVEYRCLFTDGPTTVYTSSTITLTNVSAVEFYVTIPLSLFTKGASKGKYKAGTVIAQPRAQSFVANENFPRQAYLFGVDRAPGYPVYGDVPTTQNLLAPGAYGADFRIGH